MKRMLKIVFFFLIFSGPAAFAQTFPAEPEDISPLLIGEEVPNGEVYTAKGKETKLHKVLDGKPTVLVFYRGGWCPFCNVQLAELQDALAELEELGYQIVAVSTDAPDKASKVLSKKNLYYTLLADPEVTLARAFGIAFKAPARYEKTLTEGSDGKNKELLLPVPSVFILDKDAVIQFEYINPNFKVRLESKILLGNARMLALKR